MREHQTTKLATSAAPTSISPPPVNLTEERPETPPIIKKWINPEHDRKCDVCDIEFRTKKLLEVSN